MTNTQAHPDGGSRNAGALTDDTCPECKLQRGGIVVGEDKAYRTSLTIRCGSCGSLTVPYTRSVALFAAERDRLRQQNAKLREALEKIDKMPCISDLLGEGHGEDDPEYPPCGCAHCLAHAALARSQP